MYLDETFSDKLETEYVAGVDENNVEQVLEDIIKSGADIVFCVGPQMMPNSLKVAVEHPELYTQLFAECASSLYQNILWTYV